MGKMSVIVNAVAFIAGYNLRLLIINQSPSQLEDIYGKEAARTLTTNFACRVLYTPRDQKDAQEYSEIIGYETFKKPFQFAFFGAWHEPQPKYFRPKTRCHEP